MKNPWIKENSTNRRKSQIIFECKDFDVFPVTPEFLAVMQREDSFSKNIEKLLAELSLKSPKKDSQKNFDCWVSSIFEDFKSEFSYLAYINKAELVQICMSDNHGKNYIYFSDVNSFLDNIPKEDHAYKVVSSLHDFKGSFGKLLQGVSEAMFFKFLFTDKFNNCNGYTTVFFPELK